MLVLSTKADDFRDSVGASPFAHGKPQIVDEIPYNLIDALMNLTSFLLSLLFLVHCTPSYINY